MNLFNQKTVTHIFNNLNKGAGLARGDSAINLANTNLANGYDYNALILASASGVNVYDRGTDSRIFGSKGRRVRSASSSSSDLNPSARK